MLSARRYERTISAGLRFVLPLLGLAGAVLSLTPAAASDLVHVNPEIIFKADTGAIMVPLDFAAEINRAVASYDPETGLIGITGREIELQLQIHNPNFLINGKQWIQLKTPPAELTVEDKQLCLVPLHEVCALMGGAVFERDGNLFVRRPKEKTHLTWETSKLLDTLEIEHGMPAPPAGEEPVPAPIAKPVPAPVRQGLPEIPAKHRPKTRKTKRFPAASRAPRFSVSLGANNYIPDGGEVSQDRFEYNLAPRVSLRARLSNRIELEAGYSRWESTISGWLPEFVAGTQSGTLRAASQTYYFAVRYRQALHENLVLSIAPGVIRNKGTFDIMHPTGNYRNTDIDNGICLDLSFDYWFSPSLSLWFGALLTRSSLTLQTPGVTVSMDALSPAAGITVGF